MVVGRSEGRGMHEKLALQTDSLLIHLVWSCTKAAAIYYSAQLTFIPVVRAACAV